MHDLLPGISGEEWERALVIERARRRGKARISDDPVNLILIFKNRKDVPVLDDAEEIKAWLTKTYDMSASTRSINEARRILEDQDRHRIVLKIIEQHDREPFPAEVNIPEILMSDLAWVTGAFRLKIVADALERLGYRRRRRGSLAVWIREN